MERQHGNKLILVGFMGTGKSTVSKLLASRLECKRVDVDERIVSSTGHAISDIFAESGEEGFRDIEARVLADILANDAPSVIATGGGAVLREANRDLMLASGLVVALTADAARIIDRVQSDDARPLLQGDAASRVNTLLEQRKHAYDFAHIAVDTTSLTADEVVAVIMEHWGKKQ
ncbi:shikimate kinase [Paenibacillus harenae]|uniref:Shikimate kinase n=1 Tax=Paenibacillus harenae TaxID=306543 RepID=A0ABT9TZX2_PAEHA|nr:shikimate kinase [Paenibacillus harenae]MDQ0059525.1 shikimate kinase [Paenibacillus harenae]MDQ0112940.1 shikimate kinase [Paenibacillus harenae]